MSISRWTLPLLALFLLATQCAAPLAAAPPRAEPDLPALLELADREVPVRYTPGALDRAARVRDRMRPLARELSEIVKRPVPVRVYLLDRDEWRAGGFQRPFGLPEATASGALALPAVADAESVDLWRRLLGGALPPTRGASVIANPQELAALAAADILGLAEAARLAVESAGPRVEPPWVAELLTHLAAALAFTAWGEENAPEIEAVWVRLVAAGGGDGALRLADFAEQASFAQWLWFQGEFARGASALLASKSKRKVRGLLADALRKDELVAAGVLFERYPALDDWRRLAFRP